VGMAVCLLWVSCVIR